MRYQAALHPDVRRCPTKSTPARQAAFSRQGSRVHRGHPRAHPSRSIHAVIVNRNLLRRWQVFQNHDFIYPGSLSEELGSRADQSSLAPDSTTPVVAVRWRQALRSVRRRPRLAKSVDAVMQYVEVEIAKLLAADPDLDAARQRAVRRAGRSSPRSAANRQLAPTC